MSEETEVRVDGVRVAKAFETDRFPVPTVTFDVESERDEAVTVRIADEVPAALEMDQVGFHPDYGGEDWTAYPDHRVEYERRLDPGESVTTVYGVRVDDAADEEFLGDPDVTAEAVGELDANDDAADPVAETTMSDIAPQERTDVVREVAGGDADAVPGMDDDDGIAVSGGEDADEADEDDDAIALSADQQDEGDDGVISLSDDGADAAGEDPLGDLGGDSGAAAEGDAGDDGADPLGGEESSDASAGDPLGEAGADADPHDGDADATADVGAEAGPVGETEEVADADPLDGNADAAADAPGGADAGAEAGSVGEAEEVADADPLDETETSTAEDPLGDDGAAVEEDGDATEDAAGTATVAGSGDGVAAALAAEIRDGAVDDEDLETLREALDGEAGGLARSDEVQVEHLHSRVGKLEAYTDALEAFIDENGTADDLLAEVEAHDDRLADLRADVEAAEDARASLREDLTERTDGVESEVAALAGTVDDVGADLERLRGDLEALEERVAAVEGDVDEVDDVADDVAALEDDIEELRTWRDQLSDVFGT